MPLATDTFFYSSQLKLSPAQVFVAAVDVVCVSSTRRTVSNARTSYLVGKKVVTLKVSNLFDSKRDKPSKGKEGLGAEKTESGFGDSSVTTFYPEKKGWFVLRVDVNASLRTVNEELVFESIKGFQVGGRVSVRNIFVSRDALDEESRPNAMALTSKPGVEVVWVDPGPVDLTGSFYGVKGDELCEKETPASDAGIEGHDARNTSPRREVSTNPFARKAETNRKSAMESVTAAAGGVSLTEQPVPDVTNLRSGHASHDTTFPNDGFESTGKQSAPVKSATRIPQTTPSALTLHTVLGASCVSPTSLAVVGSTAAYACDKAVVVRDVSGGDESNANGDSGITGNRPSGSMSKQSQQILLGHTRFVKCVVFCETGDTLVTAQIGGSPIVIAWRRLGGTDDTTAPKYVRFATLHLVDFESLTSLDVSRDGAKVAAVGVLMNNNSRPFLKKEKDGDNENDQQHSAVELWDLARSTRLGRYASDKKTTQAKFSRFRDQNNTLFACGDGFIDELTLENGSLVPKTVVLDTLDLGSLLVVSDEKGDLPENDSPYHFTTLAFHEESGGKYVFAGTKRGAVVKLSLGDSLDDTDDNSENDLVSACVPVCAFQLHDALINSLAFCAVDGKGFAATSSDDGTVKVWPCDFGTAHLVEATHGAGVRVVSACFSLDQSDSLEVITAATDGSIGRLDVWNRCYSFLAQSVSGGRAKINAIANDPVHQKIVAIACDDGVVRGIDVSDRVGATLFTCRDETKNVSRNEKPERATSLGFRRRLDGSQKNPENNTVSRLAVGYSSGVVRVFDLSYGETEPSVGTVTKVPKVTVTLVSVIADAHESGFAVDAVVWAGPWHEKVFSAGRDGFLSVSEETKEEGTDGFFAKSRVRVSHKGSEAASCVSKCGAFVFVAACPGSSSSSAAATGVAEKSSHVLCFHADTLTLVPKTWRNQRGGICAIAVVDERFVLLAGNDLAAVVSHHSITSLFEFGKNGKQTLSQTQTNLSPEALLANAIAPTAVRRNCHATGRDDTSRGASSSSNSWSSRAITGIGYDGKNGTVITSGADGTIFAVRATDASDPALLGIGDDDDDSYPSAGKTTHTSRGQRFVSPHQRVSGLAVVANETETANFETENSVAVTFGDGDAICVWCVEGNDSGDTEHVRKTAEPVETPFPEKKAFGLKETTADAVSTGDDDSDSSRENNNESRRSRNPITTSGLDLVAHEPWFGGSGGGFGLSTDGFGLSGDETRNKNSDVWANSAYPTRTLGLSVGTAAAKREVSENAAAVAASAESPSAFFMPHLGALVYATGNEILIERLGGDKTQAFLRGPHVTRITAIARHASGEVLISASASASTGNESASDSLSDSALICVWDLRTGALLQQMSHATCGGVITTLAFSPSGEYLLATGQDPAGAIKVFKRRRTGMGDQSEIKYKYESVYSTPTPSPLASGAWLGDTAFVVVGVDGATQFSVERNQGDDGASDDCSFRRREFAFQEQTKTKPSPFHSSTKTKPKPAAPVCTAIAVASDGSVFVGDSKGTVWGCGAPRNTSDTRDGYGAGNYDSVARLTLRVLRAGYAGAEPETDSNLFPQGEAVTALCAFGGFGGFGGEGSTRKEPLGLFVGSAVRARVLRRNGAREQSQGKERHAKPHDIASNWSEQGELVLDGAVVSASVSNDGNSQTKSKSRDGNSQTKSVSTSGNSQTKPNNADAGFVTCTTSAGSAWSVCLSTGVARALAHAHPTPVRHISVNSFPSGLSSLVTCTDDGVGRVFDCGSGSKSLELWNGDNDGDDDEKNEIVRGSASPCGRRVCFARTNGSVSVVEMGDTRLDISDSRNDSRNELKTTGSVTASLPCVFTPHPLGGEIVCLAWMRRSGVVCGASTPTSYVLLTVCVDGSVSVTEFDDTDGFDDTGGARNRGNTSATPRTKTKTTVLVTGGPGGVRPVLAASVDASVSPTRVALARRDGVTVLAVHEEFGASRTNCPYKAVVSFEFETNSMGIELVTHNSQGTGSYHEDKRDHQKNRAACAWSPSNAGVLFFATNGALVAIDVRNTGFPGSGFVGDRTDAVRVVSLQGDGLPPNDPIVSLAVTSSPRGDGDYVSIGFENSVLFCEIGGCETAGFPGASKPATPIVPKRVAVWHCGRDTHVTSVAWQSDESVELSNQENAKTTAWVAAGENVHAFVF